MKEHNTLMMATQASKNINQDLTKYLKDNMLKNRQKSKPWYLADERIKENKDYINPVGMSTVSSLGRSRVWGCWGDPQRIGTSCYSKRSVPYSSFFLTTTTKLLYHCHARRSLGEGGAG